MKFSGPIEAFFKAPDENPDPAGDCVLFWIRRGIVRLCGPEDTRSLDPGEAGLVAAVVILAGIDFLGRVHAGGANRSTESTFVAILRDRGSVSRTDAEALYQLRCGLVHSFALSARRLRDSRNFEFTIRDHGPLLECDPKVRDGSSYLVNFWAIRELFERVVRGMFEQCQSGDKELVGAVARMSQEKVLTA